MYLLNTKGYVVWVVQYEDGYYEDTYTSKDILFIMWTL